LVLMKGDYRLDQYSGVVSPMRAPRT
jgi:hypothetical protein